MPPNQFANVTSRTPAVDLIASPWLVGMLKIIDVDRMVTMRVAELAADTASKPSRIARSDEKRKTATATLIIVRAVRRLLRRALFSTRPMNFISSLLLADRRRLLDERALFEVQKMRGALGGVRIVRH